MALVLEQIDSEGLAQLSYLVGDDSAGLAAVIDPRRDVAVYLDKAQKLGVRITAIIETHIHADFVSGAQELQARTGAAIYGGRSEAYQFELNQMQEGDEISLGNATLRALHTPGHTPEHISLLLFDKKQGDEPIAVFTGDTLFNQDVGRPDLLGEDVTRQLANDLYQSLYEKLLPLGDRVELYPGHGAGSACGKSIGDRRQSTLGNERRFSPVFQHHSQADFVQWLLQGMPEPPRHYPVLKKLNAAGAPLKGQPPVIPPLSPQAFRERMEQGDAVVLDTRSILAFGGGHIPGALNIALLPEFPTWVGWMIDREQPILLIVESERDLALAGEHLFRVGYDTIVGYLHKGMTSWQNSALPLESAGEWTVHTLHQHLNDPDLTILDVRGDDERRAGYVPNSRHIYVAHLREHLADLDPHQTIVTYCGSGFRASIAASILQQNSFSRVINVPGSWTAWQAARLPIEKPADS
ncbi:MBL fold metallo-hydrolase [Spirosoma taeanense]|uniref:MBL fold metallo-hydrolase n=1 Tax=Spirosoma taeanense TaxID=2735870 RepID=A0A6M5YD27_9BACT|nr:MBL fold metallo-hydrolase [Spirosoma taeanense]QJW91193.1 MBL fold metallo-hydrolase [Spirosoma taeanense]